MSALSRSLNRHQMTEHGRPIVEQPPNSHSSAHLRPRPFDKLPTELIRDIFSLACSKVTLTLKDTVVPFHFELGLVCEKWHAIAAAHRSLWAAFSIRLEGERNPRFSAKLRDYLQQSGTHPLRIRVWWSRDTSNEVRFDVLNAIIPHCERWHTIKLDFSLDYCFLQKLEPIRDRLPLLEHLRIRGPRHRYPDVTQDLSMFRNAPSLNRITVCDIKTKSEGCVLALPWNHVSRANLDSFSFEKLQAPLELSQTLTTLTLIDGYSDRSSHSPFFLRSPATLRKLEVLQVRETVDVSHLTCPSLKRLEVYNEKASAIQKLLDNSSCPLVHLKLRGLGKWSFSPILRHASLAGLTFLHLEDNGVTNGAIDVLILDSRRLLPLLETLCIDVDSRQEKEKFKSQIRSLRRIVDSRTNDLRGSRESLDYLNGSIKHTTIMSLKECRFRFREYQGGWYKWQDRILQCFQSFCNSRNVLGAMNGFGESYGQNNCPCNESHCYHIEDSDHASNDNSDDDYNYEYYDNYDSDHI